MLNSRQRAQLRGMANTYDTIFQIGKSGVSENLINQVSAALFARELIKLKVLETAPASVREIAEEVAAGCGADVVQVIGSKFILYKHSNNKDITPIKLVK